MVCGGLIISTDNAGVARARHEMESALADWLIDSQDPLLSPGKRLPGPSRSRIMGWLCGPEID
jgi:hypothetical protein